MGPDDFKYLVINPYSDHAEAALLLLSSVMQNLDGCYNIVLDSSMNQPVENPYFDEQLADFDSRRASLQAAADAAEGAEKPRWRNPCNPLMRSGNSLFRKAAGGLIRCRCPQPAICTRCLHPGFNPIWRLAENTRAVR